MQPNITDRHYLTDFTIGLSFKVKPEANKVIVTLLPYATSIKYEDNADMVTTISYNGQTVTATSHEFDIEDTAPLTNVGFGLESTPVEVLIHDTALDNKYPHKELFLIPNN